MYSCYNILYCQTRADRVRSHFEITWEIHSFPQISSHINPSATAANILGVTITKDKLLAIQTIPSKSGRNIEKTGHAVVCISDSIKSSNRISGLHLECDNPEIRMQHSEWMHICWKELIFSLNDAVLGVYLKILHEPLMSISRKAPWYDTTVRAMVQVPLLWFRQDYTWLVFQYTFI